uniref:Rubisco LSMT substrate-binding domain-containing protein n=1 Tax=Anopheles atroparvus TaxID=41427 RepID=A0AAG5CMN2_ANOAO
MPFYPPATWTPVPRTRWAVSTVMTRQNNVPVNLAGFEGLDSTLALIPYWDMANHDHPARRKDELVGPRLIAETVYNAGNERLECQVFKEEDQSKDFSSPTPIFITYGNRTDAEFLVHNGFVVRWNPDTRVTKPFKLNPEDHLYKQRFHLLKRKDMPTEGKFAFGNYDYGASMPPGLIALACVSAMDETDLNLHTVQSSEWLDDLSTMPPKLADQTELRLGEWLTKLLRVYPTTPEEDEALLQEGRQLNPTRRLVIQYRLEEKRVLQGYVHKSRLRPLEDVAKLSIATLSDEK